MNIIKVKRSAGKCRFSILIPSWNNLEYLQLSIRSIRKHSTHNHQIIVHINEGTDGTLEWIKSQPDIDYTYSEQNIGICYALNAAGDLLETDYVVYMNDDMYVCPGWDTALLHEIERIGHNYFFLSATAIEPYDSRNDCVLVKDYGTSITGFQETELLKNFSVPFKEDWQGATWPPNVVHRDVWNLVGGYSIEFSPGMYSDPDFSMKLWMAGVRIFKGLGKSRAYHFGSKSTSRITKNKGYYTFISKWGITPATLAKYYLNRGRLYDGPLLSKKLPLMIQWKNAYKRIESLLKSKSI